MHPALDNSDQPPACIHAPASPPPTRVPCSLQGYLEWYFKPVFSTNCQGEWEPNGTYHQTDIIRDKGLAYIE